MDCNAVILGASGTLGHMVAGVLAARFAVRACSRSGPDRFAVEEGDDGLRRVLQEAPGALVVNAIGFPANRMDQTDPRAMSRAIRINAEFPHRLCEVAGDFRCRVLHFSTDGVFRRDRGTVSEQDRPDPDDSYGMTKLLGETSTAHALTIRCSFVGPDPAGRGLWEWLARQPQGARVPGYVDQQWGGCTSRQLAELTAGLVNEDAFQASRSAGPVQHFAPNPVITKHDLLCYLRDVWRPDVTVLEAMSDKPTSRILVGGNALPRLPSPENRPWPRILSECHLPDR